MYTNLKNVIIITIIQIILSLYKVFNLLAIIFIKILNLNVVFDVMLF